MSDLNIRKSGQAGRITFNRPKALNALTHQMALDLHAALNEWRDYPQVALVIIDAEGEKAFCAGGDVAAVYHAGLRGDHQAGRDFFRDEYRMNAAIADYPKPIVAFMQGFVMGGGVGVAGHAGHRIVGDTTQISMPEAGIGLIPDVGGTWLLGRASGRIGEYLALTCGRIAAGDAIHAGFADSYLPEAEWPGLISLLEETGDATRITGIDPPPVSLAARDLSAFGERNVSDIIAALEKNGDEEALKPIRRNSPLSMAAGLAMVRAARGDRRMQESLSREYRFTWRATKHSDFLEGVRAQIIDKDRKPQWSADPSETHVQKLLSPLGENELRWKEKA
ncbi:enoyl-CoA hydratase/isomerase family protein [Paracoccus saliphilus]|uniref:3-hydroxyisobutyryl-CoA hydrolase n=1 Tax=Paracoccus saliphilus TaxID=405559 RepID=A0AA45W366_9RHOB|nr:enoyl-CoA hydratase/isomerase family protein [Paracoccus saliphilus]WCR04932.1 enoyl-CoA hydratase/isomerase family protein [Paracoccus saliphilus]SIS72428.1 Enoyl-CoA hydratase/carnithine racemase [Paracoccus saliphilus]